MNSNLSYFTSTYDTIKQMITFRPHSREDIQFRVLWLNNKKANIYAIDNLNHITNTGEQEQWFNDYEQKQKSGEKQFFTISYDDKPIGFMGLSNIDNLKKTAEVFVMIGEDGCRGKGFGTESMQFLINHAFNKLKLKSLHSEINKRNLPSINLCKQLGFAEVGEDDDEIKVILYHS